MLRTKIAEFLSIPDLPFRVSIQVTSDHKKAVLLSLSSKTSKVLDRLCKGTQVENPSQCSNSNMVNCSGPTGYL